ncbi:tetratricopeptide repeat protein [Schlesneria paludicola]|uniref:tetratricopeptide repeat protein n=1 Tax=Schlesneria paludicola TaxID=360056 RepID=UPI000299D482|nr:tetratricopeptide repeat protein [Schlesneria paludicola]
MSDVSCAESLASLAKNGSIATTRNRVTIDLDQSRAAGVLIGRSVTVRTLILLVAMSWMSLSCIARADEGLDDYNVAVSLFNQSRWKPATEQFRQFLVNHAKHEKAPLARLYLGLTLGKLEDYKAARDELRRFADENRQNPNLGQARYRIGECSYLMDDWTNARVELEEFVETFPGDAMCEYALPYLGDTILRQKDPAAALPVFDRSIEKFPRGRLIDDAKFGRARSLELLKRFDDAIGQYLDLAKKKDGARAADAQLHLGAIYFERKQYPEAIASYSEFANDFPQSPQLPQAQLNLGYAYYQSGKFAEAARQFERVSKEKSQVTTASYWLGRSLKSLGDYSKASEVLQTAAAGAKDLPLFEAITFEQALCERYQQHPVEARQYFEQVLAKFPTGDLADDSLHALIELSIDAGDLPEAEKLLARFGQEFPQSGLRLQVEMLSGRLDLVRAGAAKRDKKPNGDVVAFYESAAQHFDHVLNESTIPRTQRQARYYLALTRQLQEKPAQAIELIAPLVQQVVADGAKSDFVDAIVLQADCQYQLKDYEPAVVSTQSYLDLVPSGRQRARALSLQALAADGLNNTTIAVAALERLTKEHPKHALTSLTLQELAEAAEARQEWSAAARYYATLADLVAEPEKKAYALRGVALAQYSQQQFEDAATSFGKIVDEFPNLSLIAECAYYRAESWLKAKQPEKAMGYFQQIFQSLPEAQPAARGAELEPPLEYAYKAGWWVARILTKENKIDEADAAYEALLTRFPEAKELDKRLYEWAILNHENQRFERSEVIWRRLIKDAPESVFANNAKLHLAESDFDANRFEEAEKAFKELATSPQSTDEVKEWSLYQLVVLAVFQQRWADVKAIGQQLQEQFPNSIHRYYVAYGQAESYLTAAKPTPDELTAAREILNSLRKEAGNTEVAQTEWFDRVWVLLAEIHFREQHEDEVRTVVEELKLRAPKSPFLYQAEEVLGRSYKQQAKFEDARAAFERVLANPAANRTETAAKAQFMIGETYFLQEKWSSAFVAYYKVYSLYKFPDWQAFGLLMSGRCDENQGEWKQAIETYERLMQEFPNFPQMDDVKMRLEMARKKVGG